MKYKGITITEPSLEMFEEFIQETNLPIVAEEVYNHYKKRNWLTKKGTKAKSVEVLCNAWNSIPEHRVGVILGNAKNKTKNIDWEQRRYEIAKAILAASHIAQQIGEYSYIEKNEVKDSVRMADLLIEELKKDNQLKQITIMKLKMVTGCMTDSLTINGKEEIDLTDDERVDVWNKVCEYLIANGKHRQLNEFLQFVLTHHGKYGCSTEPCEQCGDYVETYKLDI